MSKGDWGVRMRLGLGVDSDRCDRGGGVKRDFD